LSRIYIV